MKPESKYNVTMMMSSNTPCTPVEPTMQGEKRSSRKKKYTSPVIASFSSNRTLMLSCEQKLGQNAMMLVSGKMEYPWGFHFYFKEM